MPTLDPPPLDFLPRQDPAQMRPFVQEADGHLNLRFDMATVQSTMRVADPWALVLEYTRTMMRCLLFNASPRAMLMLGLGGGSLAKYCHHSLPQADITVVEINPHVIALRAQFQVPPQGPRFRVVPGDGARHVQDLALRNKGLAGSDRVAYDVILVDAFHFDGAPAAINSRAFFRACQSLLAPRGVLVVNLEADPASCQPVLAQLSHAFDGAVWSVLSDGSSNRIAFACDAQHLMATMRQADTRLAALPPVHRETLTRRVGKRLAFEPLFS